MRHFLILAFCMTALNCLAEDLDASRAALRERLEKAEKAEANENFRAALELYSSATRDYPDFAEAWAGLGEHLRFYSHDPKAAADAFERSVAAKHQDANAIAFAWRGLGELAAKEGNDAKAIECFEKSLKAKPLADTHRSLCHLYGKQRNFKEAARHAGEAVKLNPDDSIARLLFAAQLYRADEKDAGRREFQSALKNAGMKEDGSADHPVHCCIIYNAAGFLGVTGENDAALKMLKRFFETPNHRHLTREDIETDPDFVALQKLPAFRAMLDEYLPQKSQQK